MRSRPAEVERAVSVVAREGLLVRPFVAVVAQLAQETALGRAKRFAEDIVPGLPHELEKRGSVPIGNLSLGVKTVLAHEAARLGRGAILVRALEFARRRTVRARSSAVPSPCRHVRDW